jgi:hypothetical protein
MKLLPTYLGPSTTFRAFVQVSLFVSSGFLFWTVDLSPFSQTIILIARILFISFLAKVMSLLHLSVLV